MKVIKVEAGKEATMVNINSGLESFQAVVDGPIEAIYPFDDEVALICNEEGKLRNLPHNRVLLNKHGEMVDIICGTFFLCGIEDDHFADIPEELAEEYLHLFWSPERFTFHMVNGQKALQIDKPLGF